MTPLTNEYEGDGQDKGEHVAPERLVVLAVTLGEKADDGVQLILAQALRGTGTGKAGCSVGAELRVTERAQGQGGKWEAGLG